MDQQDAKMWLTELALSQVPVHPQTARDLYEAAGEPVPEYLQIRVPDLTPEQIIHFREEWLKLFSGAPANTTRVIGIDWAVPNLIHTSVIYKHREVGRSEGLALAIPTKPRPKLFKTYEEVVPWRFRRKGLPCK
jgi:hypothetical protein